MKKQKTVWTAPSDLNHVPPHPCINFISGHTKVLEKQRQTKKHAKHHIQYVYLSPSGSAILCVLCFCFVVFWCWWGWMEPKRRDAAEVKRNYEISTLKAYKTKTKFVQSIFSGRIELSQVYSYSVLLLAFQKISPVNVLF